MSRSHFNKPRPRKLTSEERFCAIMDELRGIRRTLLILANQGVTEMATLQDIQTQVQANKDVTDSAIVLLNGLHTALQDAINNNDPAAMQAIVDDLGNQKQALADAVTANTPAANP